MILVLYRLMLLHHLQTKRGDNMKSVYEKPEMEIKEFTNEDIITVSGGLVKSKFSLGESVIEF